MNEKLGQNPAFGFSYQEEKGYLNQPGSHLIPKKELGMSKRFYAACMAMQGMLSCDSRNSLEVNQESLIIKSFRIADELLKQENL